MYTREINALADVAAEKVQQQRHSLPAHLVRSALAGMYIGAAIALILVVGGSVASHWPHMAKPAMGICFGGALTIVYFAGSELFTGTNLVQTLGVLNRKARLIDLVSNWCWTWLGNLIGGIGLAVLVARSGILSGQHAREFVLHYTQAKMNLPFEQLFLRAVLANWLVCLGVWMSARLKSEPAKIIMIWWCMFTFITCSFEHSVANMCGLMIGLLLNHGELAGISLSAYGYNLSIATLGNIVGGAGLVAGMYWLGSPGAWRTRREGASEAIDLPSGRVAEMIRT